MEEHLIQMRRRVSDGDVHGVMCRGAAECVHRLDG